MHWTKQLAGANERLDSSCRKDSPSRKKPLCSVGSHKRSRRWRYSRIVMQISVWAVYYMYRILSTRLVIWQFEALGTYVSRPHGIPKISYLAFWRGRSKVSKKVQYILQILKSSRSSILNQVVYYTKLPHSKNWNSPKRYVGGCLLSLWMCLISLDY